MRVGGKRTKPLSIEVLCDWDERVQPTTTQRQRRRVYIQYLQFQTRRVIPFSYRADAFPSRTDWMCVFLSIIF